MGKWPSSSSSKSRGKWYHRWGKPNKMSREVVRCLSHWQKQPIQDRETGRWIAEKDSGIRLTRKIQGLVLPACSRLYQGPCGYWWSMKCLRHQWKESRGRRGRPNWLSDMNRPPSSRTWSNRAGPKAGKTGYFQLRETAGVSRHSLCGRCSQHSSRTSR